RVRLLRDQTFPAALQRLVVQSLAVAALLPADSQQRRTRAVEQLFERGAALGQRTAAIVGAAFAQEIERDERDALSAVGQRFSAGQFFLTPAQVDPALQILEPGRLAVVVERDDLAVEDQRLLAPARPVLQRRRDLGKLTRLLVAEARPQADVIAFRRNFDDRADAVVLRLVDEVGIVERRVDERREHRL